MSPNSKVPKSEFHVLKNHMYEEYINECNKLGFSKTNRFNKPLHLYSFYVYLANNSLWKLINREKINAEEIEIMKKLKCYKPSRNEMGYRYHAPFYKVEIPLID